MKKKKLFSVICVLFALTSLAQNHVINDETGLIGVVSFDNDKSNLRTEDKASLLSLIKNFSKNKINITGYTDSDGEADYNLALSKRRAERVKHFLIQNGYPAKNIIRINANGEIKEGVKAFNRRVDINLDIDMIPPPEMVMEVDEKIELKTEIVEIKENKTPTLEEEFSNLQIGQTLAIKNLNFIPGRHFLLPNSESTLNEVLQILNDNPTLVIEVQGHICCMDQDKDGLDLDTQTMNLSINRAQYIYNYLINNGISPYRLSYKGFGASKPLVSEITEEDQAKNRRVEILIVNK